MRLLSHVLLSLILWAVSGASLAAAVNELEGKVVLNGQTEGIKIRSIVHKGMNHPESGNPGEAKEASPGICPQQRQTLKAPEHVYKMTNPLEPTADNLRAGEVLFNIDARPTACKVCHGFGGDGMGIIFEQLTPKPRNFTCYYTMEDIPDGQIYWIIKNGSPGTPMPSFGYLSDKEVWQLVLHIRQFANQKK